MSHSAGFGGFKLSSLLSNVNIGLSVGLNELFVMLQLPNLGCVFSFRVRCCLIINSRCVLYIITRLIKTSLSERIQSRLPARCYPAFTAALRLCGQRSDVSFSFIGTVPLWDQNNLINYDNKAEGFHCCLLKLARVVRYCAQRCFRSQRVCNTPSSC